MIFSYFWHTIKYLKPVQIYGRVWFRLYQPRPDTSPAPDTRNPQASWCPSCPKSESIKKQPQNQNTETCNNDNNAGLTPIFSVYNRQLSS
jgi:hypothetical protein